MQGLPRLTIEERILLVLVEHLRYMEEFQVPAALTQEGLSELLNVNRPNIARSLKALKQKGIVIERISHVKGQRRRKKVYLVSPDRTETALRLRSEVGTSIVTFNGKDVPLNHICLELKVPLIEAYIIASGRAQGRPEANPAPSKQMEQFFIGREVEVHRLMEWLKDPTIPVAVVSGMGGIGKTALLSKVLSLTKDRRCLWFRFTEGSSFKGNLHSLEVLLERPGFGGGSEPRDIAQNLAKALSDGALLVLDDVHLAGKEMEDVLAAFIALWPPSVKLIVATRKRRTFYSARDASMDRRVLELQLDGLSEKDSLELLRLRGFDEGRSKALYRLTKGLPIALLLTPMEAVRDGTDFGPDMGSFFVSEVLKKLGPDELKALRTLSVLRVPCARAHPLLSLLSLDPAVLDELLLRSLVTWGPHGYEVHPVISEMVRARTPKDELAAIHTSAARFYLSEDRTIPGTLEALHHLSSAGRTDELVQHLKEKGMALLDEGYLELLVLLEWIDPSKLGPEGSAWLNLLMGAGEYWMNEPGRALGHLRRAQEASKVAKLKDRSFRSSLSTFMGRVLLDVGSPEEAARWFRMADEAYDPTEYNEDMDQINGTWAMNGLGLALMATGDMKGALKAFDNALARCKEYDPGDMTPSILGNIAKVRLLEGEPKEALVQLERGLSISDGLKDMYTSARLHELMGETFAMMGQSQKASEHFELAIEHSSSEEELRKVSELYLAQATKHTHTSIGQRLAAFLGGSRSKRTAELARTYNRICRIEREKDTLPSPEFHRKAALLFKEAGMDRMVGKAINNLAYSLSVRGRKDEAVTKYREALDILSKVKDEKGEAITTYNLSDLLGEMGMHEASQDMMDRAIHLMERCGMEKDARTIRANLKRTKKHDRQGKG